jgi:hypothetical protein
MEFLSELQYFAEKSSAVNFTSALYVLKLEYRMAKIEAMLGL